MKALLIIILAFTFYTAQAQIGSKYLSAKVGYDFRDIYMTEISYEFSTKYYNRWEIFGNFYHRPNTLQRADSVFSQGTQGKFLRIDSTSANKPYETLLFGVNFKPILFKKINTMTRLNVGAGLGANNLQFTSALFLGFEISQTLPNRMELTFSNQNSIWLWAPRSERFRFIFSAGLRIPIN